MSAYLNRGIISLFQGYDEPSETQKFNILEQAISVSVAKGFYEKIGDKVYRCSREKGIQEKKGKAAEEILSVWDHFGMNIPYEYWDILGNVQIISPKWKSKKENVELMGQSYNIIDNNRMIGYQSFLRDTYGLNMRSETSKEISEFEKMFFHDFMDMVKNADNVGIILTIK
jgi:hypothetical protein